MKRLSLTATCLLYILFSLPLWACGPYFPDYIRSAEQISPLRSPYTYNESFSGTSPGIIFPSWRIMFLYQAYRGLANGDAHMISLPGAIDKTAHLDWLAARKSVTDKDAQVNRWAEGEYFAYFRNYLDDAFYTAANTLNERKKVFNRQEMDIWLEGQDEVFGSIEGRLFDEEFDRDIANPLLKQDREYQRAAACFYARRYQEAEERFREISENPEHPWRIYSALAACRTLMRRANAEHDAELKKYGTREEGRKKAVAARDTWLRKADDCLESVLKDTTLEPVHPSAGRLREYIMFRLEPLKRFAEAENVLLSAISPSEIGWNLSDFAILYSGLKQKDKDFIIQNGGDFSQWLMAMQSEIEEPAGFAAKKWGEKKSLPWLIASLKTMSPDSPWIGGILQEALEIPADSPAYMSARYYYFSYLVKSGFDREKLAEQLDSFIGTLDRGKAPAEWNCFADLRMLVSPSLEEALQRSLRKVVAAHDDYETLSGDFELLDKKIQSMFNECMPLEKWAEIVLQEGLFTPGIMKQLSFTAFTRAVLLNDFPAAEKIASKLSETDAQLKKDFSGFLESSTFGEKKFSAVFFMLNYPRLNTILDSAADEIIVKNLPLNIRDIYRRNWWRPYETSSPAGQRENLQGHAEELLQLLPEGLIEKAQEENRLLSDIAAPNYLADTVIKYASENPKDPRVPKALHLAVQATRYAGFKDEETSRYSRKAFQILHRGYPGNEWTEKTPYWY